ncbi:hypothetical protein K0M31_007700 [Melipona bicolor]|uniref:Uncharacterized protein n=1 Tax=Melipona bicolor TaxID=60889 RepID=A0AA40GBW8_9HYME|nr:hypothetical protein K0M31_007700 [Melipona bicolor]
MTKLTKRYGVRVEGNWNEYRSNYTAICEITTRGVFSTSGSAGAKGHRLGLPFPARIRAILSTRQVAVLRCCQKRPELLNRLWDTLLRNWSQ